MRAGDAVHTQLTSLMNREQSDALSNRCALLLIDGLSMREERVAHAVQGALGHIPLVGGSAGDDLRFHATSVYYDGRFHAESAVVTLLATDAPMTVFKTQHFTAGAERLVVTAAESDRRIVNELNGQPATEAYAELLGVDPSKLTPDLLAASPFIATGEFRLAFQPLFRGGSSHEVAGFEVLLRWAHPVRGIIPPMQFIPLAEETGLIIPLGRWILETACEEAASWPIPYVIAINVSPRQITEADLVSLVVDVLDRTGLSPGRLEIEITETLLIVDGEPASQVLQQLCDLGVRIVLGDFGTGYSSLSYLQRFPLSRVKIDKSFINELTVSPKARSIASAILELGHQLQLEVTAEGVETLEQLEMLEQRRCDQFQGYLLARPIPQSQVRDFILRAASRR